MRHVPTQRVDGLLSELRSDDMTVEFDPAAPEHWTDENVADLVAAARLCRCSSVLIYLYQQWTIRTLQPALVLLETSPFIKDLSIYVLEARTEEKRRMTDLLLEACVRNPHATIVDFTMYATASPGSLARFLSRMSLNVLWFFERTLTNGRSVTAFASALGRSLQRLDIGFVNSRHTIQLLHSLTDLPNLESFKLKTPLDRPSLLPALAQAMEKLPNLYSFYLWSTSDEYDSLDLSEWLATTRFPSGLNLLSLTSLWLDDLDYPTTLRNKSMGALSMYRCRIGPSGFQALSRFEAVKTLHMQQCDLYYYDTDQSLLCLPALERLQFVDIQNMGELNTLFWGSPRHLKLNCIGFMQEWYLAELTKRLDPPVRLRTLEIVLHDIAKGVLSVLGDAIASLVGLEQVKIDKRGQSRLVDQGDSLVLMRWLQQTHLKSIELCSFAFDATQLVEEAIEIARKNPCLESFAPLPPAGKRTTTSRQRDCQEAKRELQLLLKANQYGRRLLFAPVPAGLWGSILTRIQDEDADARFLLVKELTGTLSAQVYGPAPLPDKQIGWTPVQGRRRNVAPLGAA